MSSPRVPLFFPHSPLLLFLLSSSFIIPLSSATSFISFNHSLSGNQTLTSQGGKFVLGFFQPGNQSSHRYYIGIWYKKVSEFTVVWVANRDSPISDPSSSELRISGDGNLVLLSQSKTQLWSTNLTSMASNYTVAEILDSGNLVLRDWLDPSKIFWESMDHPTDTWLPGAKVGLNKVTGEIQILTSWKNSDDPAPGIFSGQMDPNGSNQIFLLRNKFRQYWTTGIWNGLAFPFIPEMVGTNLSAATSIFSTEFVSNATMNYFTYNIKSDVIWRNVIDVSGQIKVQIWMEGTQQWMLFFSLPKKQCDVFAFCGPFSSCNEKSQPFCQCVKGFSVVSPREWDLGDRSQGCARNTPLNCGGNGSSAANKDRFFMMPGMILPDDPHSLAAASIDDCELACLNNCSCTAYSYDSGCLVWYGNLLNLQQQSDPSSGETLYLRLAASELPNSKGKKGTVYGLVAGLAAGVLAFMAVVLALIWWRRRKQRSTGEAVEGNLVSFTYSDLQRMTKNFSENLGRGSFGSVFKGMLPDSTAIAVKKLDGLLHQGEKQFRTEVSTLGIIQHVNLIRLRGFCSEGAKKLLVYDYMPNGSLDTLFHSNSLVLDWNARYNIALGAARGLAYLHEKCRDCIIHCDVKPENILLDASFVPKVTDFGLAKLLGRDFSRVLTTTRGTIGYLAPEWISGMPITAKADTYSYGMMLLEIISGRRNIKHSGEGSGDYFPTLAAIKVVEGDVGLLDYRLERNVNLEEVDRACKVACWCIQANEIDRPSMGQVVQILEGVIKVNTPPIPRHLQVLAGNLENIIPFKNTTPCQIATSASTQA